tara:strand:+ start:1830 stop:3251 length:1422 start_codon:yes stop_codon:yes gene_type:complete
MGTFYSGAAGNTLSSSVNLNDTRRKFNFGERVAELAPVQSPFFVYLSKVAKKATNDPVFKFLEQRHQWQRRNFEVETAEAMGALGASDDTVAEAYVKWKPTTLSLTCKYDKYGKITGTDTCPEYLLVGQVLVVQAEYDKDGGGAGAAVPIRVTLKITSLGTKDATGIEIAADILSINIASTGAVIVDADLTAGTSTLTFADGDLGQVIGTSWAEGDTSATGWEDKLYDREGYCQIFKTGMNIFSGTSLATEYRGISNEFQRIWQDKLMEHKMDLEQAFLFGIGSSSHETGTGAPTRQTWGILPYTEQYGKIYNMTYSSSGYDAFLDAMEDFFAPESGNSGNKLVLASRKVITYLNKLGSGSFLNNSVGSSQYRMDINTIPGAFGHQVTVVNTIFGSLHFVQEPLLRGMWEDYCVMVDMKNLAYRPLQGNGMNRDTFIETNVQENDRDGRKDQIITEAGLEISVPETHAILKFS